MTTSKRLDRWLQVAVVVGVFAGPATAADIWVSGTGSDEFGDGSSGSPFRTITTAMQAANANDTIKVLTGDYDVDAGETFPILVKDQVSIIGQESSEQDYPRIGGDLTSTSVEALVVIDGTAGNRQYISIENLRFLGQDDEDFDSPSAFIIICSLNSGLQDCSFKNNICERGEMNDSSSADRPTILIDGSEGGSASSCTIESNTLYASVLGAIEVRGSSSASQSTNVGGLIVYNNTIANAENTSGDFGFYWNGANGRSLTGAALIRDNTIVATSQGLRVGIWVELDDTTIGGNVIGSFFNVAKVTGNLIAGCSGDGVLLSSDGVSNLTIGPFARNKIRNNGDSGVRVWFDPDADEDGEGYVNVQSEGNIVVDNGECGYEVSGLGDESNGTSRFTNDTIAGNGLAGVGFNSWNDPVNFISLANFQSRFTAIRNIILWGNNAGGGYEQVTGLSSHLAGAFAGHTSYSTWQYLSDPTDGNDNTDPHFVDAPNGDYHLDASEESTAIDGGRISAAVTESVDIDGESRIQDSDFPCEGTPVPIIDRGADEVPEPDCP